MFTIEKAYKVPEFFLEGGGGQLMCSTIFSVLFYQITQYLKVTSTSISYQMS